VTIDWFGHRKGVRWTPAELARRLSEGIRHGEPVGVMLHHAVSHESERDSIADLVALAAKHPKSRPTTIQKVAATRSHAVDAKP